jgi:hypothetical protein
MANITEKVSALDKRVGALENSDFDDTAALARIVKQYDNVKISMTLKVDLHQCKVCSETLLCSDTLII